MTKLTEATIGLHLARAIDHIDEGRLTANDTIGYARSGDSRWRSDARTIEGKYGQGILANKSILSTDHPTWAIPAPLLALLLQ